MEKIFFSEKEKKLSIKELVDKYKISRSGASRARKKGWVYKDFDPCKLHPRKKNNIKASGRFSVLNLTEEERRMSVKDISKKLDISKSGASRAINKGWVKKGRAVNILPNNILPEGVSGEDILKACKIAAHYAVVQASASFQEVDDAAQSAAVRLLELTGHEKFQYPGWRWKVAYWTATAYLHKKFKLNVTEEVAKEFENGELENIGISYPGVEEKITIANIRRNIGEGKWTILWEWAENGYSKQSQKIIEILAQIKKEGKCLLAEDQDFSV